MIPRINGKKSTKLYRLFDSMGTRGGKLAYLRDTFGPSREEGLSHRRAAFPNSSLPWTKRYVVLLGGNCQSRDQPRATLLR